VNGLMKRRLIIVVLVVGVMLGLLIGWHLLVGHFIAQALAKNSLPPQTVTTMVAGYSDWQPEITAVGSLRAVRGVDITTEVTGIVRNVDFHSGDDAKRGQVLVRLNADADIATLHSLEAIAELAGTVYTRDKVQF
jgi:membrane fusion protein, multidrug efflux system